MSYATEKWLRARLKKAIEAIRIAEGIIEYCPGDRWEREVTAEDRARFAKLVEELNDDLV